MYIYIYIYIYVCVCVSVCLSSSSSSCHATSTYFPDSLYVSFSDSLYPSLSIFHYIYIYIYMFVCVCVCVNHHHHVTLLAHISLTFSLSLYPSLLSITPSKFSKLYQWSEQSWSRLVLGGQPTLVCPFEELHRRTSLTCCPSVSSSDP